VRDQGGTPYVACKLCYDFVRGCFNHDRKGTCACNEHARKPSCWAASALADAWLTACLDAYNQSVLHASGVFFISNGSRPRASNVEHSARQQQSS
jgi:hypothetical protein